MATPIFPWIGGKRRLAAAIIPTFPAHDCYVEPFCGAAALFFMKAPSDVEVLNDVNGELVNVFRVVKFHPEELIRQFKWALSSRQIFEWHKMTPTPILTDIQRAARFLYMQKLAFGGKVEGQTFGVGTTQQGRLNILRLEEELSEAHLRLSRVTVEHLNWEDCVDRYDRAHTLFYCDPPYWKTEGYGVPFMLTDYERMALVLSKIKGKAVISLNDHPDIRRVFKGYRIQTVKITYQVDNRREKTPSSELIIRSW